MRGATPPSGRCSIAIQISIHAPRAGRDHETYTETCQSLLFQSTRPVRGATGGNGRFEHDRVLFQSTRPVRGATVSRSFRGGRNRDFNPRAPCGARPPPLSVANPLEWYFNPRAPCGARHQRRVALETAENISIHAPRAGRDHSPFVPGIHGGTISIHAPRAGRDSKSIQNYFTHFCDKRQFLDNFTQNAAF